jgi:hypothetical protein
MDLAPDFDEFIGSLIAQRAEFLVVGALGSDLRFDAVTQRIGLPK